MPVSGFGPASTTATVSARLDGVQVLVIDDDRDALELAVAVLTAAGATVRVATSASEGFKTFASWRPNVLVVDIEMPVEGGYAFIRRVRALDRQAGGGTPAVALTAYARPKDRDLAVSAGYTMHVPKPVDPGELAGRSRRVRGHRRQPRRDGSGVIAGRTSGILVIMDIEIKRCFV